MTTYVAFLRAINVGGHTVTMAVLKGCFESLGLADVSTFVASGNVIFSAARRSPDTLTRSIARHLRTELGYDVETFLRTVDEVAAIARYRPFPQARLDAASALNVAFLAKPLDVAGRRALTRLRTNIDDFRAHGREVYWLCATKQSQSTFSNVVFERALGIRSTFRSITTVRRLADRLAT